MRRLSLFLFSAAAVGALSVPAMADIVVGVAGPLTGQYAVFGVQMQHGADLAVKDINAKGGINGQKLVLKVGDDACDPKQAVAVANQLVNEKVVFVDGHFCSGSSIPASKVYHEEGILQITPASTNPTFTEQGFDNTFRTCGRDDVQGVFAANYVVDHKLGSKVAVIDDKTQYGKGLADVFRQQLNKRGVKEVIDEEITAGDKDFSALVTKLKQAGVDLIYFGGYHTEAGLITRQARGQGLEAQIVSGDALQTQQYWNIAGKTGEGFMMTFPADPRDLPTAAEVVKEFKAEGFDPEGYTLYTYAAMQVFKDAATKAGSTDLDAVTKVMHDTTFNTVLGPIAFNKNGDINNPVYVMYRWHDGNYAEIKG